MINIIKELKDYGLDVHVKDVEADKEEAQRFYNINLEDKNELPQADAIVFAVAHKDYVDNKQDYLKLVKDNGVVLDIKGVIE
ncbi:UDP binding domain-containing protein, partial [Staphylococcus haemolyticus]|uniref:UDP binding domain-containing protein n=1 Tax=Staphylococcus haemolyticus TaxID=1283 RepID=UPI002795CC62